MTANEALGPREYMGVASSGASLALIRNSDLVT